MSRTSPMPGAAVRKTLIDTIWSTITAVWKNLSRKKQALTGNYQGIAIQKQLVPDASYRQNAGRFVCG